jgi:predicted nuclease of predicted toxin-antitoxin system
VNIIADENVARLIAERLSNEGHDVKRITEVARGSKDEAVLSLAVQGDALLLTGDKDFGELVFRQRRSTSGVVLIRLEGFSNADKAEIVSQEFQRSGENLLHAFTVITQRGVRVRQTPS